MEYVVSLERYYGPMDLLLYLLEKNQLDIYDIPIALITDQFMEHLEVSLERNLDHIGEFLSMASYLLNLKSRMLLPQRRGEEGEEEAEDGRMSLVQQLLEYRRFKGVAQQLEQMVDDEEHRVFFRQAGNLSDFRSEALSGNMQALRRVYEQLLQGLEADAIYAIPQDEIRMEEKMEAVAQYMSGRPLASAGQLFALARTRRELTVMFLAILELIRRGQLSARQDSEDDDIELIWLEGVVYDVDEG